MAIMKTKLYILFGLMISPIIAFAQEQETIKKPAPTVIYIVKLIPSNKEIVTQNLIIDPQKIASALILPRNEAEQRFGKIDYPIVWVITPKPGVKLTSIGEFYKHRKLTGNTKNLPIAIDGQVIKDTTNLLIEESSIKEFKKSKDSVLVKSSSYLHYLDLKKKELMR
jgi:hypothetical protein